MATVLGVMKSPDDMVTAIKDLKGAGFRELEIYSPVPSHAIEEALDRGPAVSRESRSPTSCRSGARTTGRW